MQQFLDLLGFRCKDRVTGFSGAVTSVSFDLFGCVTAFVSPPLDDKGAIPDGRWFDHHRLERMDGDRVMAMPTFMSTVPTAPKAEPKGAQEKPAPSRW